MSTAHATAFVLTSPNTRLVVEDGRLYLGARDSEQVGLPVFDLKEISSDAACRFVFSVLKAAQLTVDDLQKVPFSTRAPKEVPSTSAWINYAETELCISVNAHPKWRSEGDRTRAEEIHKEHVDSYLLEWGVSRRVARYATRVIDQGLRQAWLCGQLFKTATGWAYEPERTVPA